MSSPYLGLLYIPGARMRMADKGIKKVSGFGRGDHYINIKIKVNEH